MANLGCSFPGCDAHPSKGDSILRINPKGEPFIGRCKKHLATDAEREQLARDEREAHRQIDSGEALGA